MRGRLGEVAGFAREGCSESDPDRDLNIHPNVYVPRKQTDYTASQYTWWKTDRRGDTRRGGGQRPDVNRGLDGERESSTI